MRTKLLELTGDDKIRMGQFFKLFDTDLDNYINLGEFEKMLKKLEINFDK